MKLHKQILGALALGSMAFSGTAQAACWTPAEADAATVRDLQSRLMVATLRCARSEHDLLAEYNRFVGSKKPLLQMGNGVLKAHFAKGRTKRQAQQAYDRYAVSLANKYGAGSGDLSECEGMKRLAVLAANSQANQSSLVELANMHRLDPVLPNGRCGIVLASAD